MTGGASEFLATGIDLAHRALNRMTHVSILVAHALTPSTFRAVDDARARGCREVLLDQRALFRYAGDPRLDMTDAFLRRALAKGDRCYAVLDGDTLASYKWCSSRPTDINEHLRLFFGNEWIYSYKALTLPDYRGRRLHARLTAMVLSEALVGSAKGVVCCVDINNVPSLKSFARMGATRVGMLSAVRLCGTYWTHRSVGCAEYGLSLAPLRVTPAH